jgi:hypothetical protein
VLRFVMESGAKGCEVIVSGKLRAARAKSMKFKDGYMVSAGDPARVFLDSSVRHVLLRQGMLGIKARRARAPGGRAGGRTRPCTPGAGPAAGRGARGAAPTPGRLPRGSGSVGAALAPSAAEHDAARAHAPQNLPC